MAELEPVSESWTRALCVVAHPDDLEFGAAAAVARWTGQGKTVVYAMVTSGEAGIDGLAPDECARGPGGRAGRVGPDRRRRRRSSSSGCPDGVLEYGVALRRAICAVVRKHRPEIVITNNFRDTWGGAALNQADHIATGKATLDAVRDAGNRWIFSEQLVDGLEPWGGVKQVWAPAPGRPARRSTPPDLRPRRRLAARPQGLHRRPRLGELRSRGVPRGRRAGGRPAARRADGDDLRGVLAGLGRLTSRLCRVLSLASYASTGAGHERCLTNCHRAGVPLVLFEHAF